MKRKLIAAAVALILALSCLPFSAFSVIAGATSSEKSAAETPEAEATEAQMPAAERSVPVEPYWTVPEGYDEHDYNKCAAFIEQEDENGVKNGTKLDENYDVNDPTTWGLYYDDESEWARFIWTEEFPHRLLNVNVYDCNLVGELDFSGCTALDGLFCDVNLLTKLDVSGCIALTYLQCYGNLLTELDVSGCTALAYLDCYDNLLTELDFSGFQNFQLDFLHAEGRGSIGCYIDLFVGVEYVCAKASGVAKLIGWYDAEDEQVSEYWEFEITGTNLTELTARFTSLYDENDYTECLAFFEQTDENGVKNGEKLFDEYDPTDPKTWMNLSWCDTVPYKLQYAFVHERELTGELDLSGCTALMHLYCFSNELTKLDLSGCVSLTRLGCSDNPVTELDLSGCTALIYLHCNDTLLTELDISDSPELPLDFLRADGPGTVGCFFYKDVDTPAATVYAKANDGAIFIGWYNAGGDLLSENAEFDISDLGLTELIARFRDSVHTVTFVDWDGTVLSEQQVEDGAAAVAPDAPSRVGHNFIGWDIAFDNVIEDLTVTAQYGLATMHITYTGAYNGTDEVLYGGDAVLPVYGTAGLHFTFTVNGEPWDGTNITEDVTVTVGIDIDVYTVVFFDPVGNEELSVQQVMFGGEATAPDAPEHYGYTFAGWNADITYITGDMTVSAVYEPVNFTVIFTDGYGNVLETQLVPYQSAAAEPETPTVEGYTFTGWDADFSCVEADMTVNATWTRTVCTVTFTGVYTGTAEVFYGENCELPVYPSEYLHYTFTVGGEPWDGLNVTSDLTVVVDAAPNSTIYTVTFVDWDGTVLSTQSVRYGNAATAPADPVREGYTFVGWDKPFDSVQHDMTVTALYEEGGLEPTLPGDVNLDGVVDTTDALLVLRSTMSLVTLAEQGIANGDMNDDGVVDTTDAVLIMRLALAG